MDILKNIDWDDYNEDKRRRRIECLTVLQVIQCSVFSSVHYYNDHSVQVDNSDTDTNSKGTLMMLLHIVIHLHSYYLLSGSVK